MGANTLRVLASDLGYLETWCELATAPPLPWSAPESLLLKFVAHHLCNSVERADGPHAPDTVRRRLTSWSILTRWQGLAGAFSAPSLNRFTPRRAHHAVTTSAREQEGCHS